MRKKTLWFVIAFPFACLLVAFVYSLPPVHSRLAWRVDELRTRV